MSLYPDLATRDTPFFKNSLSWLLSYFPTRVMYLRHILSDVHRQFLLPFFLLFARVTPFPRRKHFVQSMEAILYYNAPGARVCLLIHLYTCRTVVVVAIVLEGALYFFPPRRQSLGNGHTFTFFSYIHKTYMPIHFQWPGLNKPSRAVKKRLCWMLGLLFFFFRETSVCHIVTCRIKRATVRESTDKSGREVDATYCSLNVTTNEEARSNRIPFSNLLILLYRT